MYNKYCSKKSAANIEQTFLLIKIIQRNPLFLT